MARTPSARGSDRDPRERARAARRRSRLRARPDPGGSAPAARPRADDPPPEARGPRRGACGAGPADSSDGRGVSLSQTLDEFVRRRGRGADLLDILAEAVRPGKERRVRSSPSRTCRPAERTPGTGFVLLLGSFVGQVHVAHALLGSRPPGKVNPFTAPDLALVPSPERGPVSDRRTIRWRGRFVDAFRSYFQRDESGA